MAKRRTIILCLPAAAGGGMQSLGTFKEVLVVLARHNVSADGSGPSGRGVSPGMAILHGPGFTCELPDGGDLKADISQIMTTVTDEDFAWPVLSNLCKVNKWKMTDPDTGRSFG